jgi:hypothetical protein
MERILVDAIGLSRGCIALCTMIYFYRFGGIDSTAIARVKSIGIDYSAFVPVLCGRVVLRVIVIVTTRCAAASN